MKVCQEIDVDNVTIVINPQNKLEAKFPELDTGIEVEEIKLDEMATLPIVAINGQQYTIGKIGVIKGTPWMVFQLAGYAHEPTVDPEPIVDEPSQPPLKQYQLSLDSPGAGTYYYTKGEGYNGLRYKFSADVIDNTTSNLLDPSQIKTLKFTANASNTYKTFEVPYESPYIVDFSDFEDSGADSGFGVSDISVVLQDGTEIFAHAVLPGGLISVLPD